MDVNRSCRKARGSRILPQFPTDIVVHRGGCGLGCLRARLGRLPPPAELGALVPRAALRAPGDCRPSLADHWLLPSSRSATRTITASIADIRSSCTAKRCSIAPSRTSIAVRRPSIAVRRLSIAVKRCCRSRTSAVRVRTRAPSSSRLTFSSLMVCFRAYARQRVTSHRCRRCVFCSRSKLL
jgi:hypothetical protein